MRNCDVILAFGFVSNSFSYTSAFFSACNKPFLAPSPSKWILHALTNPEVNLDFESETTSLPLNLKEHRLKAKETWETIALTEARERKIERIDMRSNAKIYDRKSFETFASKVKGTYFINGLGSCKVGDRLTHPFEAHGFLKSFAFKGDGTIVMKASLINTVLTRLECMMNTMLARGVMSSVAAYNLGGALLNILAPDERNTANLAVTVWPPTDEYEVDPILIVGGDNSHPYVVDLKTLETLGPLDQALNVGDIKEVLKGRKMLAHTRVDEERQRLIMCSSTFKLPGEGKGGGNTLIEFFEFDTDFKLVSSKTHITDFMVFHDWMITEDYYVIPKNPAVFQPGGVAKFLLGMAQGIEALQMDEDELGSIMLIPRNPKHNNAIEAESDTFFNIFHMGPCYQDEDDSVVVYGSVFDSYKFGGEMGFDASTQEFDPIAWSASSNAPAPRLDKFIIDQKNGNIISRERFALYDEQMVDIPIDMPSFRTDGAKMRYSYFSGAARPEGWFPFRSILKVDLETGEVNNFDFGNGKVVSEAIFVPTGDQEEDEGFVMSIVHDAETKSCELVIWEASRFSNGPIAAVDIGTLMPWCVHGSWTSACA